jgi:transposase-like protein
MTKPISYKRHRFPPEIIADTVWLYFRFPLSLRLMEEMLLERGIVVSYEGDVTLTRNTALYWSRKNRTSRKISDLAFVESGLFVLINDYTQLI